MTSLLKMLSEPYFVCEVDLKPIPQSRPKVARNGRVYYSKLSTAYRRDIVFMLRSLFKRKVISEPCSIKMLVNGLRKGADLDNMAKQLIDSLVDADIIADDSWSTVRHIEIEYDESMPEGVRIEINLLEYGYGKDN